MQSEIKSKRTERSVRQREFSNIQLVKKKINLNNGTNEVSVRAKPVSPDMKAPTEQTGNQHGGQAVNNNMGGISDQSINNYIGSIGDQAVNN